MVQSTMVQAQAQLKSAVEALVLNLKVFEGLATQIDHKSNQKKARLLSVTISKGLKEFRELSVALGKIPER